MPGGCWRHNRWSNLYSMKLLRWMAAGLVCCAALGQNGTSVKDVEWPSYAADTRGTRYRPLDQINASNFSKLEVVWRLKTDNIGNRPEYKLEGTPLMVHGTLFATAG